MKFSRNFASSSDALPNSIEDQKKSLHRNLVLYLAEFGIYSCWQPLFRLIIQTFTLLEKSAEISSGGAEMLMGDAKSRLGDANFWWEDASPLQFKYRTE